MAKQKKTNMGSYKKDEIMKVSYKYIIIYFLITNLFSYLQIRITSLLYVLQA